MKVRIRIIVLFVIVGCIGLRILTNDGRAQDNAGSPIGPDPREIPIPRIVTPIGNLPGVKDLPVRKEMPDVMVMNDGTNVTTPQQWKKRREEMKRILAYYAVGQMPPAPGNVKGREVKSETVLAASVNYRLIHLTFGPSEKLALDIGVFTPAAGGPFPAIILQAGSPPGAALLPRLAQGPKPQWLGRRRPSAHGFRSGRFASCSRHSQRRRAFCSFQCCSRRFWRTRNSADHREPVRRNLSAADMRLSFSTPMIVPRTPLSAILMAVGRFATRDSIRRIPATIGEFSRAGARGLARVADYLATDRAIDATRLIITGASRNGKSSMVAAAFDERLMGAPVVTGGGGIGAYRFAGPRKSETLDIMQKKYPNWFSPNLHEFWGQREKLPFDEHWFLALAAPRPFIALEGITDTISLPEAVRQSILGAQPAYALFGMKDRLGVNYANHAHAFTPEDWTAMTDFFDKNLRGKQIDRTFDRFPTEAELDGAAAKLTAGRGQ